MDSGRDSPVDVEQMLSNDLASIAALNLDLNTDSNSSAQNQPVSSERKP